jgi:hypothetical protein
MMRMKGAGDDKRKDQGEAMNSYEDRCRAAVEKLGDDIGYGNIMQLCEEIWSRKAAAEGIPGSAHSRGPCVFFLVPCPCPSPVKCDWCCGNGRVTKRVSEAMKSIKTEAETKRLRLLTNRKWQHIRNAKIEREYIAITVSDLRFLLRIAQGETEK